MVASEERGASSAGTCPECKIEAGEWRAYYDKFPGIKTSDDWPPSEDRRTDDDGRQLACGSCRSGPELPVKVVLQAGSNLKKKRKTITLKNVNM